MSSREGETVQEKRMECKFLYIVNTVHGERERERERLREAESLSERVQKRPTCNNKRAFKLQHENRPSILAAPAKP